MEKIFIALGSHPKCNLNAIFRKLQSKGISCFILQLYIFESELLQILNCLVKVWSLLLLLALLFLGSFQLGKKPVDNILLFFSFLLNVLLHLKS